MHRTLARAVFVLFCGALAAALGIGTAMLYTSAGRKLLVRIVGERASRLVRGTVSLGAVNGSWFGGVDIERVVIKDSTGALFADVPHLTVRYRLADIIGGRYVFASVTLDRPVIQIIKHRNGRVNYEDIFHLSEGDPGKPGTPELVEINNLRIVDGNMTVRLPWSPDGRLRTLPEVDSALATERAKPGRRIEDGAEGLEMIRTIDNLDAELPLLRVSTPKRDPLTVRIERLAARISDPELSIRNLRAEVRTKDDSLLFEVDRADLPASSMRGSGRLDWPRDTILYHFNLDARRLALADLRWISPGFPDLTGVAKVRAQSVSGSRTEYDIRDLALGDSASRISGRMIALTDVYRGLGFRRLALTLSNVDIDVIRPYLDSVPFYGKLTGRLGADGFFDGMTVSLDWLFDDARVAGGARSHLGLDGRLLLGGADGMYFDQAQLSNTDVDLRTVRLVAPAVILEGRLGLAGKLTGPWKNVVFDGNAEHQDDGLVPSRLSGRVRLDTRGAVLGLETDVVLDSLAFDGIRRTFPTLPARGALGGRVKLAGMLDNLSVDADVGGAIGRIRAVGRANLSPPKWATDSVQLTFSNLDLSQLTGTGSPTNLQGTLTASGVIDSAVAPSGRIAVRLGPGTVREFAVDSAMARLSAADSLLRVDTLRVDFASGRLDGSGAIGWTNPKTGRIALHAEAKDLAPFDSLALSLTGFRRDTLAGDARMAGRAKADVTLEGAVGALTIDGNFVLEPFRWLGYRARNLQGNLALTARDSALSTALSADSLSVGRLTFTTLRATAAGRPDNFRWTFSTWARDSGRVAAVGRYYHRGNTTRVGADTVNLELLGRRWALASPFNAAITDSLVSIDSLRLVTRDGSGSLELVGTISRGASADLAVTALGVQLRDLYGLTQRDTTGIAGSIHLDGRLSGTAKAPEFRGTGALTGGVFGDFQAPLIRSAFDYRDKLLRSNLTFWRTGTPVVEVDASLPLDLALVQVAKRQLPGALTIVATGDSVDLAIVEAFTPNLRRVTGLLEMDVRVEGSWDSPRLAGAARLIGGAMDVPALGVRYGPVSGGLRFSGDSISADSVRVRGHEGDLLVTGGIRLERLTQPILGLTLSAREFEVIDVPDYLKLHTWGDVTLSGPLVRPVLTGAGRLTNSVIYFADLVSKDIVNLEDPMNADLVDTLALRTQNLRANFQSRFLDSLRIIDMDFIVGENVWLRSSEANFQLEGRLRVNKIRSGYRMDGDLSTPRGTYTLRVGPINRTFTVERGSVRYFGDLNAELDVQARHVVKTPSGVGNEIPVIARITGTLEVPKLALSTPPDRPPLSEPELISLLVLGTTDPAAAAQLGATSSQVYALGAYALNALTAELQRALISKSGAGLDIVEIRPGIATSGFRGGPTSGTQVAIGGALTSKLFIIANAGFCFASNQNLLSARNLGASLEYRFRRELRLVVSAEPLQTCLPIGADALTSARRYQFGGDLRWDRDY